jgi:hypothetical protein
MSNSTDKDLFKLLGKFEQQQKMPPVESWHPEVEGEIDINIDSQGRWFHEGGHFDRQDLARMFASILRREGDDYYLVTPAEKLKIRVQDVPFSIVLMSERQGGLNFITSLGDEVEMGGDHPLEFRKNPQSSPQSQKESAEFIPYIMIRNNLWAKLNQSTYYELINLVQETAEGYVLRSKDYEVVIPE